MSYLEETDFGNGNKLDNTVNVLIKHLKQPYKKNKIGGKGGLLYFRKVHG